jgi:drug/metabolite transporter (DMT)-like permease
MNRIAGAILILAGAVLIAVSDFDPKAKLGIGIVLAVGGVVIMATSNVRIDDDKK